MVHAVPSRATLAVSPAGIVNDGACASDLDGGIMRETDVNAENFPHLVKKPVAGAEFSAGAARRPSRAVICCKTAFGYSLDELLSETHML